MRATIDLTDRTAHRSSAEGPLRVLLVQSAPEQPEADGLRAVLEQVGESVEIEEVGSLTRALARLETEPAPALVLLDPDLPDAGGLESLRLIASRHPAPLKVLCPGRGREHLGKAGVAEGADDYILPDELDPHALARVLRYARRRRTAEADLRQAGTRYRTLFERAPDGILVCDERGVLRDVNPQLAELFGYEPGELIGESVELLVPEMHRDAHMAYRLDYTRDPVPRPMGLERNLTGRRKDGSTIPIEVGLAPLPFPGHRLVVASVRDISAAEERRRLAEIVDASDDAIIGISIDGTIESWNRGAARYFACKREETVGRPLSRFLAPEVLEQLPDILRRLRAGEHVPSVENFHVTEDGRRLHLAFTFSPLTDRSGEVTRAAVIGRDITRRKILEADLEELAYRDPLTRVANRRFLRERLEYALSLARREQSRVGLLYLDIGNFKEINDRFGHSAGDVVLADVARRFEAQARESDLVARFGGDEFVILLSKVDDEEGALEATHRFETALEAPISLPDGREVAVRAEFGVALYPDHGKEADELLAAADRAMYARKEAKWPGVQVGVGLARGQSVERQIREALEADQFGLHFQRITRASDGSLAGAEILLRWKRPEDGTLSAGEFLPSVWDLGLMPEIDIWVVSRLLNTAHDPRLASAGIWLAVNLSDRTLKDDEAMESLASAIGELGLPAGGLRIEIRESPAMVSPWLVEGMERLKGLGATIVLDNYGVGHSSLAQLREIPADALKVDGLLVSRLDADPATSRILHAAIELGRAVGMQVGVEGIERAAQATGLRGNGCDFLQGFFFGRPVPLDEFFS